MTTQLPPGRALPRRAAARAVPAGDRAAQERTSTWSRSTAAPITGAGRWRSCGSTTRRSSARGSRDGAHLRASRRTRRTENAALEVEGRVIAYASAPAGVAWFDFAGAVRRAALARPTISTWRGASIPCWFPACGASAGDRRCGAPLHLAGRRVLRPPGEADPFGRGAARGAVSRGGERPDANIERTVSRLAEMQTRRVPERAAPSRRITF